MDINIGKNFVEICSQIIELNKSLEEWMRVESDDYFQTESYEGGFDATEKAFCFSYYTPSGEEYWFQQKNWRPNIRLLFLAFFAKCIKTNDIAFYCVGRNFKFIFFVGIVLFWRALCAFCLSSG